nr:hypothetical protein [Ferruginibacter sp.]
HTSASVMTTTFLTDPMTQLYTVPSYAAQANTWNLHEFDVPFVWDGVSNIVIEFRQTTPPTTATTTTNQMSPGFTCITYSGSTTGYAATTGTTISTRVDLKIIH